MRASLTSCWHARPPSRCTSLRPYVYPGVQRFCATELTHKPLLQIILTRKDELLEISPDDTDVLHVTLQNLPKPLDLEGLISSTVELFTKTPPESLPYGAWRAISPYSVLRTTREPRALTTQTLEQGEELFAKHEEQIRRANIYKARVTAIKRGLWRYRRPAGGFAMAIAVGVLAWWLGRSDHGATYLSTIRQTLYIFFGQYR